MSSFSKEILVGANDTSTVTLEMNLNEGRYFSISGHEYDRNLITDEQGERMADDFVDGLDYIWEEQKKDGKTTSTFDEWKQEWRNSENWFDTVGDIISVGDRYAQLVGCGQIQDTFTGLTELKITKVEQKVISRLWRIYQLSKPEQIPEDYLRVLREIFEKYPEFDPEQLTEFA